MEQALQAIACVASWVCGCIKTRVTEQCEYLDNINKLTENKLTLIAKVDDMKIRLQKEEEQGKTRTNMVQNWFRKANDFTTNIDGLLEETKEANCTARLKLGQQIPELMREVGDFLKNNESFPLADYVPTRGKILPTPSLVGKTTAQKSMEKVWQCLMDDETRTIGVYGMGGVGKTTILKKINNRLSEQKDRFDKVIWVTVSKDATLRKLQDDIAKALDETLPNAGDETERSTFLHQALKQRKKFALILDDMWQAFALHEIGIPDFTKDNGCKLVLTTRSLDVCKRMGCKKHIQVELLSEDEAWELFSKTVDVMLEPHVEKIAKDVAKKCFRLPLAVITVGGAMRGKDGIQEWGVALTDWQESTNWMSLDMDEKVIERLKFSYNRLGDDILKKCFLYYALWPEDYSMHPENLIEHWVMEGLINGKSIENELDRGHVILDKLRSCCMLESGLDFFRVAEMVKMHDLMREMALNITKTKPRFMVKAGLQFNGVGAEEEWGEDLETVSFIGSGIEEILISPNCPGLTTLLLNDIGSLKRITHGFFVQMPSLRVLNLSGSIEIELLPESISDLVNLQVLNLSWCYWLKRVPSVEKLQSLRVLRLDETSIEELPHGMEALINLKRLYMPSSIQKLPASFLSKFCLLQELVFPRLRVSIDLHLDELLSLSHLESLSICFESLYDLSYYLGSDKFKGLDYFSFYVGFSLHSPRRRRSVEIYKNSAHHIPDNTLLFPQNTEDLQINGLNELTTLSDLATNARGLRTCTINFCSELEYILSSEENYNLLQHLEELKISGCPKLFTLYKGGVVDGSILPCLKKLDIWGCDNLKHLFSRRMLQYLQNLEEISTVRCQEIEELITEEEEITSEGSSNNNKIILLPRLKELYLENLPKLKSIWKGEEMVCNSLQTVVVDECDELKRLPQLGGDDQLPAPSLQRIKGSTKWWDSLEWDYPSAKYVLQPLFQAYDDNGSSADGGGKEGEVIAEQGVNNPSTSRDADDDDKNSADDDDESSADDDESSADDDDESSDDGGGEEGEVIAEQGVNNPSTSRDADDDDKSSAGEPHNRV